MRVVSFNVNGLRARIHQMQALVERYQPDVIGLQETKVDDSEFPVEAMRDLGYEVAWHGQKGHYGVALLSRYPMDEVTTRLEGNDDDEHCRFIRARVQVGDTPVWVLNGYFPQGENRDHPVKFPHKRDFYARLLALLKSRYSPDEPLVLMGDMNISPEDKDIGIGEDNRKRWLRTGKTSFLPEEREWLQQLKDWGLQDTFRIIHPDADDQFSWFDYRSRGFERDPKRGLRIDLILATPPLARTCTDAGIALDIRAMERPSDHSPVWADFDLPSN